MIKAIITTIFMAIMTVSFPIREKRMIDLALKIYILAVLFVTILARDNQGFGQMHLIPLEHVWV